MFDSQNLTKQETMYTKVELHIAAIALIGDLAKPGVCRKPCISSLNLHTTPLVLTGDTSYTLTTVMVWGKPSYSFII